MTGCGDDECKANIKKKFEDYDKTLYDAQDGIVYTVRDKMDKKEADETFVKKVKSKIGVGIVLIIVSAISTIVYNVYSSEFRYVEKGEMKTLKEETVFPLKEKVSTIMTDNENIKQDTQEIKESIKDMAHDFKEELKQQREDTNQKFEDIKELIKSFHRKGGNES